jgi:hypothetical protein
LNRNESGRFGALKSDSTHHFFRNVCRTPNNLTKGKSKLIIIKTDKISQQPENCEKRNDPDLVQAFLKQLWVVSDFKVLLKMALNTMTIVLKIRQHDPST